jgi:predicted DCC family thiol-disulfide oxidoreductase YuxK
MSQSRMTTANDAVIVYDGDCPFCSSYVHLLRLRESIGPVAVVNAREPSPAVDEVLSLGLDLDEGMALKYHGQWYHGDDCIHMLALLSSRSGVANRIMAWLFQSPRRAHVLYPWMRAGRNFTLRLLGRRPIAST